MGQKAMNSLIHIAGFLMTLWLADYFLDDLSLTAPGFAVLAFACLVFIFMIMAIFHDVKGLRMRDDE